jgi:hypothetical protein
MKLISQRWGLSAVAVAAALVLGAIGITTFTSTGGAAQQVGASSTPQTSTPGGVIPATMGNSTTYEYTIPDGQSVTDGIPVTFCVTGEPQDPSWSSFQVQIGNQGNGGNLLGVTFPGNVTFTSAETIPASLLPVCKNATIQIATGPLTLTDPQIAQMFGKNINISDVLPFPSTGSSKPHVNWSGATEIHIKALVKPATSNISCFITDPSGNFLTACDGSLADQSGSDSGRFAIVANKKNIEVSTNPGQFYYNVLYHNPGSAAITVDVNFVKSGVSPKGAQAIHAGLFAPPFSGITQDGFNDVNDGIPEGTDDTVLGITIPAGWTLWVDYHLAWDGLGSPVPTGCATECPNANQPFSVSCTVTDTGGHSETCTAGAWGYKK